MLGVSDRALRMATETKVIRRVRTEAGVRRYKQPIGSIIINDSLLVGLSDGGTDSKGRSLVKGENGKTYSIGLEKAKSGSKQYVGRDESGKEVTRSFNEVDVYAEIGRIVQTEAGIDTRGPGSPFGSDPRRAGWSNNQVEAASDEIAAWGNSMEEHGYGLQDAFYNVSGNLDQHRDLRVARHELEQLRDQARKSDADPEYAKYNHTRGTAEDALNSAISTVVSEGKLPKRYDAATEAAYADEVLKNAAANANKPRPVRTQDIGHGQWIRSVDGEGKPQSDWFQVSNIGEQSRIPGRSRAIRGKTRDGKLISLTQQGPRQKWETIADPKDQPAFVPPPPPEKPFVSKRVHHISKGDRIHINGESGYMQDYMPDKDDYSSAERRKNPVYTLDISDDPAGKVNRRKITVPKGSVSAPPEEVSATATPATTRGGWNFKKEKSEYRGYDKYVGANGRTMYVDSDDTGHDIYDANDNLLAQVGPDDDALSAKLHELGTGNITASTPRGYDASRHGSLKEAESEYDGYDKFMAGKTAYYVAQEDGMTVAYDKNDREVARSADRQQLLDDLNARHAPKEVEVQQTSLKRLKSKFDGWKRFQLPDGRAVDTGQATEDDGRWYATGKGGWDEIIADGDSEDEMMRKLRTIAGIEQPMTFSPSNTDVTPKREASPIAGMSRDEYLKAQRRGDALRSSVVGTTGSEEAERARIRRSAAQANAIDIKPNTVADAEGPNDMPREMAATVIGQAADYNADNRWSVGAVTRVREVRDRLRDGTIGTAEAARRLKVAAASLEMSPVKRKEDAADIRELARQITSHDNRTLAEIRASAQARRQSAIQEAQQAAGQVIRDMKDSNSTSPLPRGSKLRDLDTGAAPVTRNGKPLTKTDRELVPQMDLGNGDRLNRLKRPNNRNLNDRLLRVAPMSDQAAYEAVQDRATENYLNGMTHAAAWKEAIETAEKIKAPDHYVQQRATYDGNGEYVVVRRNLDRSVEDVAVIRPRRGTLPDQVARGRMNQENAKARIAATRSVPVMGSPSPTSSPEKPSQATTAGGTGGSSAARMAEIQSNIQRAFDDATAHLGSGKHSIFLSKIRPHLDRMGYSRAEQDEAFIEMSRDDGPAYVWAEANQKVLTEEERRAAVNIGNQDKHLITLTRSPNAPSAPQQSAPAKTTASTLTEAQARTLARTDPAQFFALVGERYFKQGKDFRKKENEHYRRAYDEMMQYAEQMRQAEGLPGGKTGTMQGILVSMRINHAGMMGIGRTMMTIRKVFKEENGL